MNLILEGGPSLFFMETPAVMTGTRVFPRIDPLQRTATEIGTM